MQYQYNVGQSHSYRLSVFAPLLAHNDSDLSTSQSRSAFIILCSVKPDRAELISDKVLTVQRLSSDMILTAEVKVGYYHGYKWMYLLSTTYPPQKSSIGEGVICIHVQTKPKTLV